MLSSSSLLGEALKATATASDAASNDGSSSGSAAGHNGPYHSVIGLGRSSRSPSASPGLGRRIPSPNTYGAVGASSNLSGFSPQHSYQHHFSSQSPSLPTIPSASNISSTFADANDEASTSPSTSRTAALGVGSTPFPIPSKSRSSSLAPIGSGSPREQRLYERGGTTPSANVYSTSVGASATAGSSSLLSSSFPNSSPLLDRSNLGVVGNSNSPTHRGSGATSPAPYQIGSGRGLLSRHLSLSGTPLSGARGGGAAGGRTASLGRPPSAASTNATSSSTSPAMQHDTVTYSQSPGFAHEPPVHSPGSIFSQDAREGRPRTRYPFGEVVNQQSGSPTVQPPSTPLASSANTFVPSSASARIPFQQRPIASALARTVSSSDYPSGIALSNMSPFVRDVAPLPFAHGANIRNTSSISSFSRGVAESNPNGSLHNTSNTGMRNPLSASTPLSADATSRDVDNRYDNTAGVSSGDGAVPNVNHLTTAAGGLANSFGGPRRRESFWGEPQTSRSDWPDSRTGTALTSRALRGHGYGGILEQSDDEEDEDELAKPTRSGATSRRHSVAAFTTTPLTGGSSGIVSSQPGPLRSQFGFHLPGDAFNMTPARPNFANDKTSTSTASLTMSAFSPSATQQRPFDVNSSMTGAGHGKSMSSVIFKGPGDILSDSFGMPMGPSAILGRGRSDSAKFDDDDFLATNLSNALQLNLDKQQQQQQQQTSSSIRIRNATGDDMSANHPDSSPRKTLQNQYPPSGSYNGEGGSGTVRNAATAVSLSPPQNRVVRTASTSGDPYSPSASAARFLATAQNVQPPPLPPQTSLSPNPSNANPYQAMPTTPPAVPQQQRFASPNNQDSQLGMWPAPGSNVFAQHQQSPHFRSGTLPPPHSLQDFYNAPETANPPGRSFASDNVRSPTQAPSFVSPSMMARDGNVPPSHNLPMQMTSPPPHMYMQHRLPAAGTMLPPFAGFGPGMRQTSGPTQNVSQLNIHAHPYYVAPIAPQPSLNDLGRGIPLHALPSGGPLFIVEFKAGRTDLFYIDDPQSLALQKGDLVVVEADRGKDLGKVLTSCTLEEVHEFQIHQVQSALGQLAAGAGGGHTIGGIATLSPGQQPSPAAIARMTKEIHPKRIYGRASPADVALLALKAQDEQKALNVCKAKIVQHQLPMEVTDAEFQFDRRRLTFFYVADRRIDFRSLVKDLFRLYKTRIWLCAIDNGTIQQPQQG